MTERGLESANTDMFRHVQHKLKAGRTSIVNDYEIRIEAVRVRIVNWRRVSELTSTNIETRWEVRCTRNEDNETKYEAGKACELRFATDKQPRLSDKARLTRKLTKSTTNSFGARTMC